MISTAPPKLKHFSNTALADEALKARWSDAIKQTTSSNRSRTALDVLEQFFGDVDELGVTELSKRLKLHKNNVFRLLATLEARGYIEQNKATENYRLGIKCLHLGRRYIDHMGLVRQARPILADVTRKCRESAYVAVYGATASCRSRRSSPRIAQCASTADRTDVAAALHGRRQGASRVRHRRATEVVVARCR